MKKSYYRLFKKEVTLRALRFQWFGYKRSEIENIKKTIQSITNILSDTNIRWNDPDVHNNMFAKLERHKHKLANLLKEVAEF